MVMEARLSTSSCLHLAAVLQCVTLSTIDELARGLHTISQLRRNCLEVHIAPGNGHRADGKESWTVKVAVE